MSELKDYRIPTRSGNVCHCYFKSEADKVIAHQKYKRCLALAERWLFAFYVTNKCNDKFYLRSLKYRELAEEFKPNSTAQ